MYRIIIVLVFSIFLIGCEKIYEPSILIIDKVETNRSGLYIYTINKVDPHGRYNTDRILYRSEDYLGMPGDTVKFIKK